MTLSSLALSVFVGLLPLAVLTGCQTLDHSQPTTDKTPQARTVAKPQISPELLARYKWHLDSAVANHYDEQGKLITREPISDFYHPAYPISFMIFSQSENSHISFSSSCNGSGAPYFLSKDNTLKGLYLFLSTQSC